MLTLRCFVAIDYSPEIIKKISAVIEVSKRTIPARVVRWVPHSNLHLTLKFLGEIDTQQLSQIKEILAEIAGKVDPFNLDIHGSGIFPTPTRPRILWIGNSHSEPLLNLAKLIDREVSHAGVLMETRPFSPHLTIGRVNDHLEAAALRKLSADFSRIHVGELGEVQVDRINLYQSELRPGGPIYTVIGKYGLGTKSSTVRSVLE